ncbi:MAG: Hsp20/alpha crystallin family protein [Planctomycetaceae bacterium]
MARQLVNWNPWRELERLKTDFDSFFPTSPRRRGIAATEVPAVNVWQGADQVVLTAEVPGVSPEQMDVTVTADGVTLRIERPEAELQTGETWSLRERKTGSFERTIRLPFEIDTEHVEAVCEKGVLTLRLQRPESQKPHKVAVKSA